MIDAAIPLQGQAPQVPPIIGQMVALKNAGIQQQQAQQNLATGAIRQQGDQLALNQAGQDQQDNTDVRASMAAAVDPNTGQVNRGTLLSTLGKLNPTKAAQMATTLAQQDTASQEAQAKLQQAQLLAANAHVEAKDKLLQGVSDQATYTNALQQGYQLGLIKPGDLPTTYDPQLVAQLHAQTLSQKQVLDQQNKLTDQGQAAQSEKDRAAQAAATLANTQSYQQQELKLKRSEVGIQGGELALKQQQAGLSSNGAPSDLATAIAQGHIAPDRLGYLLSKNPALIQGVMQADPSFDSSKAAAYPKVYQEFTSSKNGTAGGALNAGGAALQHMHELSQMNTNESHIPGTPDYNAYQNKADTVAAELARFYGTDTVSGIAELKKTLTATLPGQRQAAIQTQAKSMGDKLDSFQQTWQNAAPSKAYQAPMPGMSPAAVAARAALDPAYKPNGGSSGMVTVQIPGSPPGKIPASALQKFKADHPNAQVSQ